MQTEKIRKERNDAELQAWNEWHDVCSVSRCSEENGKILSQVLRLAFKRRFESRGAGQILPEDCAGEFDRGIEIKSRLAKPNGGYKDLSVIGKPPAERGETFEKCYKDYVWTKARESKDPHLKVIRGCLTAEKGVINEIVDCYIRVNYPSIWASYKKNVRVDSIDAPVHGNVEKDGESDGKPLSDFLSGKDVAGDFDQEGIRSEIREFFLPRLTKEEAAVMLVYLAKTGFHLKINVTDDPDLIAFTGRKKSTLSDWCSNRIMPLLKEGWDLISNEAGVKTLSKILKDYLRSEKRATQLLMKVSDE